MAKDVILVYPPVSIKGRYRQVATGHEVPPQPLIYLGAFLRQNDFPCKLLDANALEWTIDETVQRILNLAPQYVGITSPTMLISAAGKIAKKIKENSPEILIIVGGPHVSAVPEETMVIYPDIDIGILEEGEITLIELLSALENGVNLSSVKGIIYRDQGRLKLTPPRPMMEDIDLLPFPAWDLLPDLLKYYQQTAARIDRLPNISLVSSRGCPFQCIFCARNVFGNVTRAHRAEYMIRMIKYLIKEYQIKGISFEDENFVVYKKRLVEFCNALIEERIEITWDCASNVNAVDPQLLSLMRRAGCWQINYGIESGSQRILDFIKKGITLERIESALRMTKDAGIVTKGYFIIGHPTETSESIQETIRFIKKLDLDVFQMSYMIPFPGTELYKIADQYGEFNNDWDHMNIWTPLFIPTGFTKKEIAKESKRAYREFYFRWKPVFIYLKRVLKGSNFNKFLKDGFKILKFLLGKDE